VLQRGAQRYEAAIGKVAVVALFEVAFNFRSPNGIQLAIDVRVNDVLYFLTTQLGTSHGEDPTASFTVVKCAKLYVFVEMWDEPVCENRPVYPQYHPFGAFIPSPLAGGVLN